MDANCTMNHEIVPKSIDRLRREQNVSAQHKQITNMQNITHMHNMSEMQNITNMQNMHNMYKSAVLVHKIVYLALRPLFLVPGVAKTGASSSSVSSAHAALGVVLVLAAAAREGTAGAAGAEVAERPPRRCFLAGSMRLASSASSS